MKKAIKIFLIVIVSILVLMFVLPFAFKGKIRERVEVEINKNLNATVKFGSVGLSMFSHFPDMTLKLKDLSVVGINEFKEDTLADIPSFEVTLDLFSVIRGKEYEVGRIILNHPSILLKVLKDGKVNWDITKPSETIDTTTSASAFKVKLNKIEISDASLVYDDAETPMFFGMNGLTGTLKGDMTADVTTLDVDAEVAALTADYDGVRYLGRTRAHLVTKLEADLAQWKFTFTKASLALNDLNLLADGFFSMPEDGYDMDVKFSAQENTFKSFLSLVPAIYSKDFESVKTEGTLSFDGFVKGKYTDLTIPSFGLNLKITNGMFSYPSMPGNVSQINIIASVSNPDGIIDHTIVDVPKLHLQVIQNPIDATFSLRTPDSDPEIKGTLKGVLNLQDIARFYPLPQNTSLAGSMSADIRLNGKLSTIEKGLYEQFDAAGFAIAEKVSISSPDVPMPIAISSARIDFSPAFISLSGFVMKVGNSDMSAEGKIENYIAYLFKENAVLKGELKTSSGNMDLNSFMSNSSSTEANADTAALAIVEIPANIDFTLQSSFRKIIYDDYIMEDAVGTVKIKDKTLFLQGLNVRMLGGNMALNGSYNTFDPNKPKVDMDIRIKEVEVKSAFNNFSTLQAFAPITEKLNGKISTNLAFKGNLKQDMMPELASLAGAGLLLSDQLLVDNIKTFNLIADVLKIEKLRRPSLDKINLSFDLVDGKATVKPMDFKLASYKSNFSGTIGLDQAINFVLNLEIPRSEFGGKANGVLNGLVSDASKKGLKVNLGEMVPVTLLIGGTITDPKITAGIKQAMADVVEDLKQQAIAVVQQKKEEVIAKAKVEANKWIDEAEVQAARVLSLAKAQSDQVLKSAGLASDKIKAQADSTGNKVIAEGKKNGMIAEMAAKKTAEKLKKEADNKSKKLLDEAKQRSDAMLEKARLEAEKIKEDARNRVK
ncbi:MAG: AsmA family protein [Bacteroidales bacterium]|nr:AsmA family protein [Bacteroidales bacterium]